MSGSSNATEECVTEARGHISVDDVIGAGRRVETAVVVQEADLQLHEVRLLHTPCGDRERETRSEAARERHQLRALFVSERTASAAPPNRTSPSR